MTVPPVDRAAAVHNGLTIALDATHRPDTLQRAVRSA
jgi:hypothetical protein